MLPLNAKNVAVRLMSTGLQSEGVRPPGLLRRLRGGLEVEVEVSMAAASFLLILSVSLVLSFVLYSADR